MRNPLPVGGTFNVATNVLTLTFDERIAVADPNAGDLLLDGVEANQRLSAVPATIAGRRVFWPTIPTVLITGPPPRVTYTISTGSIRGVGGGVVQAFAAFPLTLI